MMTAPRKRGRPPLPPGQRRVRRQVTVKRRTWDRLEVIGGGNHSAGIDMAVEGYDDPISHDLHGMIHYFPASLLNEIKIDARDPEDNPDYNNPDYSKETP